MLFCISSYHLIIGVVVYIIGRWVNWTGIQVDGKMVVNDSYQGSRVIEESPPPRKCCYGCFRIECASRPEDRHRMCLVRAPSIFSNISRLN